MSTKNNISIKLNSILLILILIISGETLYLGSFQSIKHQVNIKECADKNSSTQKLQCWEDLIDSTLKYQGIDKAFDIVENLYTTQPTFASNCHGYVHLIGQKAYRLFSTHQNFNLSPKTSFCGYGFYHAFMESLVLDGGDLNRARQFCDFVQQKMGNQIADAKGACYHGIGHGTADNHDQKHWDNEQALVNPALKLCEKVAPDDVLLDRCSSGVFNVLAIAYTSSRVKLDPSDPLQFCRKLTSSIYKKTCFEEMNTALFALTNGDFNKAAQFVEGIDVDDYANSGMRSLAGVYGMSLVKGMEFSKAINDCRNLQERLRLSCIKGFMGGLIEGGKPHEEYIKALNFCADSKLSENEKNACYQEFTWLSSQYYPKNEYLKICASIDQKYRKNCI